MVFPLTVDGLIYCGSMVLLNDARRGLDAHKLAYWMLGIGIAATLTVNAVSGLAYGLVGALIAGWPAVGAAGAGAVSRPHPPGMGSCAARTGRCSPGAGTITGPRPPPGSAARG